MNEVSFDWLLKTLPESSAVPSLTSRITVASRPVPFIAPTLFIQEPWLPGEVILVQASAAVGKSTIARYLSNTLGLPLLDLSRVPVSTGSLKALISDVSPAALAEFHGGTLPVVIDAMDEGRLLSGETGLESFLETMCELLMADRQVNEKPKLLILGRYDSIDIARASIQIYAPEVRISTVEVGFFTRKTAWELIEASAKLETDEHSAYRRHPLPAHALIDAYFAAIASALGLTTEALWDSPDGRAFAGYAPVLSAMGSLLAKIDNFAEVTKRLQATGAQEAWDVIETVLQTILEREQRKLADQLAGQVVQPLPASTYDPLEQLTLLAQFTDKAPLSGSGRVALPLQDKAKYYSMVERHLPEHPFLRHGELSNVVLASQVFAHAIHADVFKSSDVGRNSNISRQPFLWRSIRTRLKSNSLIDGRYLGTILNSLWNDPLHKSTKVNARPADDGTTRILIADYRGEQVEFYATSPCHLQGVLRDCDMEISGTLTFEGASPSDVDSTLHTHGAVVVVAEAVDVGVREVVFGDSTWFEAAVLTLRGRVELRMKAGAKVGWGGAFAANYPWNRFESEVQAPYQVDARDELSRFIDECWRRIPDGAVITLESDYNATDANWMRWAHRSYGRIFPRIMKALVATGAASESPFSAAGSAKLKLHFSTTWSQLRKGLLAGESADAHIQDILDELKRVARM